MEIKETRRLASLTLQEKGRHFTEYEPQGKRRGGKESGTVEGTTELARKLALDDGSGGDRVDRPLHIFATDHRQNDGDQIVKSDPAHELPTAPERSSQTPSEGKQHFFQGPSRRREHDADAEMHDANSGETSGFCSVFPVSSEFGEKPSSRSTLFSENFISSVPIDPHPRGRDQ